MIRGYPQLTVRKEPSLAIWSVFCTSGTVIFGIINPKLLALKGDKTVYLNLFFPNCNYLTVEK